MDSLVLLLEPTTELREHLSRFLVEHVQKPRHLLALLDLLVVLFAMIVDSDELYDRLLCDEDRGDHNTSQKDLLYDFGPAIARVVAWISTVVFPGVALVFVEDCDDLLSRSVSKWKARQTFHDGRFRKTYMTCTPGASCPDQ